MPEMDGLEVCRQIRKSADTPILFLSARDEEIDRVLGLEIGGDDYVTKPFSPRELVARVNAILRRARSAPPPPAQNKAMSHGGLAIDQDARSASMHCAPVSQARAKPFWAATLRLRGCTHVRRLRNRMSYANSDMSARRRRCGCGAGRRR